MREPQNHSRATGLWLLLLAVGAVTLLRTPFPAPDAERPSIVDPKVRVEIRGDIAAPGVYGFTDPPDLKAVIERAGGLTHKIHPGDPRELSSLCNSGSRLQVDIEGGRLRVAWEAMSPYHKRTLGIPLSVSRESAEGLTAVGGIGHRVAAAIVSERERRGGFERLEDLLTVPGIGPSLFEKIKPFLTL